MIRVGIIGCGRILPAHMGGLQKLKERGAADFVVTALCARKREDAEVLRVYKQVLRRAMNAKGIVKQS